jgi:hypothetical protein
VPSQGIVLDATKKGLRLLFVGVAVIGVLLAIVSGADQIVLLSGDTIEGSITRQTKSIVVLEHADLGRMEIPRSRIESVQIDSLELEIVLTDGDTLRGKIVSEDEGVFIV